MTRRSGRRGWILVVLFICLPLQVSAAQSGRIVGNVVDQQGLPLSGTRIDLFGTGRFGSSAEPYYGRSKRTGLKLESTFLSPEGIRARPLKLWRCPGNQRPSSALWASR